MNTPAVLFFFLFGLPILCGTFIAIAAILRGSSKKSRGSEADETRLIQELHGSLERLESRIEALETVLMERESKREKTL